MIPFIKICRAFALSGLLAAVTPLHAQQVVDYIVALVNEDVVLKSELDETYRNVEQQFRARGGELPSEDALRRQILERIIVTKVQVQRALQGGLQISDAELNQAMAEIASRNGMSLNEFAQALRREKIDYLQLRQQIRDDLLVERLRQREVESRIVVSSDDVDLLLEKQRRDGNDSEYHLAHILMAMPEGASEQERARTSSTAADVVAKARAGADFGQLAVIHSNSPRAIEGGDLGWRRGGELPSLFAEVVPKLKKGAISDPIVTPGGIHIVKLLDKRGGAQGTNVRETRARHILLKPNVLRSVEQTLQLLADLRQQILDGADFAALAREHSEDPGSANQGGDLGWQGPENFVPEFQSALDALKPPEISEPFRSPFGFHIVQLQERREIDRTADIQRSQARAAIFKRKMGDEYENWVRRLRDEAYVEYRPAPENV